MQNRVQKALVTDLGGVLLRTEDKAPRTRLAERFGLTYAQLDDLVFNSATGKLAEAGLIPDSDHQQYLLQQLRLDEADLPNFFDQFFQGDQLDEELLRFMVSYRKRFPVGLLSNAWLNAAEALRKRYGIDRYFDFVIFSAEVKLAKPDKRIYHLVEEKLGISPADIVYVDDNLENIRTAHELGWNAIHFIDADEVRQRIRLSLGNHSAGEG